MPGRPHPTNVRHEDVAEYNIDLTAAEHALLTRCGRCNSCGHLLALHESECETDKRCLVGNCRCENGLWRESNKPVEP